MLARVVVVNRDVVLKLDLLSFFKTRFATTFESILKQQDVSTNNKTTTKGQYIRHHSHPTHSPPTWLETVRRSFCPIQCLASIEFLKSNEK